MLTYAGCVVPVGTPGMQIQHDWDALGMRASGSHSVLFQNCRVPEPLVNPVAPYGGWHEPFIAVFMPGNFGLVAAFLGIAEAAHALLCASAKTTRKAPSNRLLAQRPGHLAVCKMFVSLPRMDAATGANEIDQRTHIPAARSRPRFKSFHIPQHILVVNYFGIPTIGSISFMARRGFFPLRKHGPNDGVLLLSDMIYPGGITLAELGSDHFLLSDHLDITSVALAITIIRWLENSDHQAPPIPSG